MNDDLRVGRVGLALTSAIAGFEPVQVIGSVVEAVGTVLKVAGLRARVGEMCTLRDPDSGSERLAEVIGFSGELALVTPFGNLDGLSRATDVHGSGGAHSLNVSDALLGRVLDGFGHPIDGGGALGAGDVRPVVAAPPHPLVRKSIDRRIVTGVRTVDALMTVGEGQRIGIFAAAGGGKSTLLGMLARGTAVDVIVIALVGERGREVRDFLEHSLCGEERERSVVVVATSDRPAMERVKCALVATTIAEYFRAKGLRVLLLVDSLTRFARAQREIGLAAGEPPTRRGYPPSLFSVLPQLLERAGSDGKGSITAFYTVLTEGDELVDPVAEEVRSILDGHIILSQKIAAQGRFPAIDVLQSKSRLMSTVADRSHQLAARKYLALLAKYHEIEFLIQVGEFKRGEDALADEAVAKISAMRTFLVQEPDRIASFDDTLTNLYRLAGTV